MPFAFLYCVARLAYNPVWNWTGDNRGHWAQQPVTHGFEYYE